MVNNKISPWVWRAMILTFICWSVYSLRKNLRKENIKIRIQGRLTGNSVRSQFPHQLLKNLTNSEDQIINASFEGENFTRNFLDKDYKYSLEPNGKTRRLPERFLQDLNPFNDEIRFSEIPKIAECDTDIKLVVLIKSSLEHIALREVIRKTWASIKVIGEYKVRILFLLGNGKYCEHHVQTALESERAKFDDLIFGDFVDSYRNLTRKALMGLTFVTTYCRNVEFLLCVDDDVFVKLPEIILQHLKKFRPSSHVMQCGLQTAYFAKVTYRGKWAVAPKIYDRTYYPPYCLGPCYLLSLDVAMALHEASRRTPNEIQIDDVMITGILREKIGMNLSFMKKGLCRHLENPYNVTEKLEKAWAEAEFLPQYRSIQLER